MKAVLRSSKRVLPISYSLIPRTRREENLIARIVKGQSDRVLTRLLSVHFPRISEEITCNLFKNTYNLAPQTFYCKFFPLQINGKHLPHYSTVHAFLLVVTTPFPVLISHWSPIHTRGIECKVVNLLDMKQCDAPKSKSDKTGAEWTKIIPATTSPDASVSSAIKL